MFKANRAADAVKDFEGSGGAFLAKSGMYNDVTIKALIYDEAANGGAVINMFVNHKGEDQVVYGDIRVFNKGGVPNKIGTEQLNELLVILGLDGLEDPVEVELPIGKKKAPKVVTVFEEVEDVEVDIKILNKYNVYNNNIMEKKTVAKFYRAGDHATAAEIVLEEENPGEVALGAKYEKDLEYAENVKYDDDLTEAQVTAWIKAKRPKGTAGASSVAKKPSFKKPVKKFGK